MKSATLERLLAARASGEPAALVTDLDSQRQWLVIGGTGDDDLSPSHRDAVRHAIAQDASGVIEGTRFFVHVFNPPERLIVVGAVHISQVLAPMAALAGYSVTIIDPRRAFATDARFPDVAMIEDWPDEAMEGLKPDARTAIVTLTHDPKIDDPALAAALASSAFYIGALGSTRTHAKRVARLTEAGVGDKVARIHAPVGLDLGGRAPREIAVSILAEVVQVRYKGAAPG